jgi:septum formation protein
VSAPPTIVLASASPRRQDLLRGAGLAFEALSPDIDETPWPGEPPDSYVLRAASDKAREALRRLAGRGPLLIVAADTTVVLEGEIFGKPASAEEASGMLRRLSGRRHEVITGLCLLLRNGAQERECGEAVRTGVVFRDLSEEDIAAYVATGEPFDKAGAYAIQGGAAGMVRAVEGSYTNVVGLPMEALSRILRACEAPGRRDQ